MKREENMKYWKKIKNLFYFFQYLKIHKKFKQNSINIKNYTAHPHDMVHVPAKFWENTSMRFWVTVRKLNVTDRRTDGRGALQYLPSRAFGAAGDNKGLVCWSLTSLCHSNGHIETMPAREINPFTALTRIRPQFLRTQWSTSNHQRVDTTTPQTAEPSGLAEITKE